MHLSRTQRFRTAVISQWAMLQMAALPLAIVFSASAAWGEDGVNLASFVETPVETAGEIPPPTKTPARKKPAAEAPLPDDEALPASSDDAALPDETPDGESLPPTANGARAAKSGKMKSADAKAGDAKSSQREQLVVGDAYTLEVKRGGVKQSFGGNLLKANDQWIVLRRMATGRNDYGVPLLSALPKVGGYFRRSYESLVEDDLWIPREAATIESHRKVDTTAAARHIPANEPPPKAHCGVAFVHDDKFVRRDGQLATMGSENVTMTFTSPFHSQYQQQIARGEILCISIPVVLSNVRMTHRDDTQARK
jgi:hypothetical protein